MPSIHQPSKAAACCLQVERVEVENLKAVGLRNKTAAMHEVRMLAKLGSCLHSTGST
jgi:hypothetical protein